MKIGIGSDFHLEFWQSSHSIQTLLDHINISDIDIFLNAGDLHPDPNLRSKFNNAIRVPNQSILGNHDFYGKQILTKSRFEMYQGGLKIVGATLWTDFKKHDPILMYQYPKVLADGGQIVKHKEFNTLADEIYSMHQDDLQFIAESNADVVVTHHAPSFRSVHPMFYQSGDINYLFMSDLDEFILNHPNIKFWIHGHTHNPVDYMIGTTRVVTNQLGYPNENNSSIDQYNLKVVEI